MNGKSKGRGIFIILIMGAMLLAACASQAAGPQITVEGAWGRPSPKVATAGAFYMLIKNGGSEADKLVGAKSDSCGMVELHESYMAEGGEMAMRPVTGGFIEIPANGQVELKVGGLHAMCMNKVDAFLPGAKVNLSLQFEKSGEQQIELEIKEQ